MLQPLLDERTRAPEPPAGRRRAALAPARRRRRGVALLAGFAVVTAVGWVATAGPGSGSVQIQDGAGSALAAGAGTGGGTTAGNNTVGSAVTSGGSAAPLSAGSPDRQAAAAVARGGAPAATTRSTGAASARAGITPSSIDAVPAGPAVTALSELPALPALSGTKVTWADPLRDVLHDQGNSVPLADGRSLWVFADTTQVSRSPGFFVTSSAAVSKRGSTRLTYAANRRHTPIEFLARTKAERSTQVAGRFYTAIWPTGATALPDGRIVIGYAKYDITLNPVSYTFRSAGLYAYRYKGVSSLKRATPATRIADGIWQPADGIVGSPVYGGDGYVYFAQCDRSNLECYSARTTPAGLADRSTYRWRTRSGGWSANRGTRAAMTYGASRPGATPSMAYLPQLGVYATTSTVAGHTAQTGMLWVAPHPWGPWSKPAAFVLPGCPAAGCYTLNLHPSETTSQRVRISYATAGVGPYVHVTDVPVRVSGGGAKVTLR